MLPLLAWLLRTSGPPVNMCPPQLLVLLPGGDGFFHMKYVQNGDEREHHAPMERVLFAIRSPSPEPSETSPA
jgi:hypothetical protein